MKKHLTQQQRSLLAIALTGVFLLTGKLFVWKTDKPASAQPDPQPVAEVTEPLTTTEPPAVSDLSPVTGQTDVQETTLLVPIEPHTEESTTVSELLTTESADILTSAVSETVTSPVSAQETTVSTTVTVPVTEATTAAPETTAPPAAASDDYFSDALFIGDSRTVGMALYAPIDGATYFATVGLSTYKIDNVTSEVPGTKDKTFAQVLAAKQYGKVYIMLGINELGNDFNYTMEHYRALIDRVKQGQPNAIIILQANLHVAYSRSATDAVVNNTVINNFNNQLAAMADGQKIYYLDANPLFDDSNGCLAADYTSDGTHPYAKHYLTWADWLRNHTIPV